jgi:hypothetical protein
MRAKSNQPFPVQAFGGRRYVPGEWTDVPAGFEEEARKNQYLIIDEPVAKVVEPEPAESKPTEDSEPAVKTPVSPTKPPAKKAGK